MPTFLVELYAPDSGAQELAKLAERARADAHAGGGKYIRSILSPQDELCLCVYESASRERLERAIAAAGLSGVRITEAVEFPNERSGRCDSNMAIEEGEQ